MVNFENEISESCTRNTFIDHVYNGVTFQVDRIVETMASLCESPNEAALLTARLNAYREVNRLGQLDKWAAPYIDEEFAAASAGIEQAGGTPMPAGTSLSTAQQLLKAELTNTMPEGAGKARFNLLQQITDVSEMRAYVCNVERYGLTTDIEMY
jgi:hypothetical protein